MDKRQSYSLFRGPCRHPLEGTTPPGRGFVVDGSGDTPAAVPSQFCTGRRVTAEAAPGPGSGAKGAGIGGKLAPPWWWWRSAWKAWGLISLLHSREKGEEGREVQWAYCLKCPSCL